MFINGALCRSGVSVQFNKNALQRSWLSPRNPGWGTKSSNILRKFLSISTSNLKITKKPQQAAVFFTILSDPYLQSRSPTIVLMLIFKIETEYEFHMKNQFPGVQLPAQQFHLYLPLTWLMGRGVLWSTCMGQGANVPPKNSEEEDVLLMSQISTVLWAVWRD